jgi:tRNA1Val (adenine37-N6)-methyltransferase
MSKDIFRFRHFDLRQQQSAHKMGTDSMLLGAWADPSGAVNILDIGTGTGVLALMLAQKNQEALIDALEPDPLSAAEASENFSASPWSFRLNCFQEPVQDFAREGHLHYDFIICNPPYFVEINTQKGHNPQQTEERRRKARTTESLSYEALVEAVGLLLVSYGTFCTVLPWRESAVFEEAAKKKGLFLVKKTEISSYGNDAPIRNLLLFGKQRANTETEKFYIYEKDGQWSRKYIDLTRNFHLAL